MNTYPTILGEVETLEMVLAGCSLARYGDGELKIIRGGSLKAQPHRPDLAARLRSILMRSGHCLVGLPTLDNRSPKIRYWRQFIREVASLTSNRMYGSSLITRPDSAPWIDTDEYWHRFEDLWRGKDVTLVRGSTKSLTADNLTSARSVREIVAPRRDAWTDYKAVLEAIGTPERALLCLGPTATVLAVDLCARGVHAIDCGHVGMFYKKWVAGIPRFVTAEDKVPAWLN